MNKSASLAALSALATFALSTGYAQTEEMEDSGATSLEEVIVTAEKRQTNLQDTAISMQVYDGEQLRMAAKKRIDEIMSGVVGVQSQDSQVGNVFSMRGVDSGFGPGGPAGVSGNTVSILVDGVVQSRGEVVRGGTLDVSQVEVMRGTQSTNLGANSLAGAISLVTNKPVIGEWESLGTVGIGNYNLTELEGVMNMPVGDDQALRVAFSKSDRDGYMSSGAGDSDLLNLRARYRWLISDDLDATVTYNHQNIGGNGVQQGVLTRNGHWEPYLEANKSTYDGRMGLPPTLGHVNSPELYSDRSNPWDDGYPKDYWPNNPFRDTDIDTFSAEIVWEAGDLGTVTVIPAYEQAQFRSAEPPRGTGDSWMGEDRSQDTFQVDARINNRNEKLDWVAGVFYYDTQFSGYFLTEGYAGAFPFNAIGPTNPCGFDDPATAAGCPTYTYDDASGTQTFSVYGDAKYSLTDALRLNLGLRYSEDTKDAVKSAGTNDGGYNYVMGYDGPTYYSHVVDGHTVLEPYQGWVLTPRFKETWSKVTYSVGVDYDVTESSMLYAAYKTGYQPGVLSTNGPASRWNATVENTSEQITFGYKSRWLEDTLQVNAEFFTIDFTDRPFGRNGNFVQVGDKTNPGCSTRGTSESPFVAYNYSCLMPNTEMVIDQNSTGVDLEISWMPTDADRIDLAVEWLDATYSSPPSAPSYDVALINAQAESVANQQGQTFVRDDAAAAALLALYNDRLDAIDGFNLQNAPEYSGNINYSHRFDLSSGSTLTPRLNLEWRGEYWSQLGSAGGLDIPINQRLDPGSPMRQGSYELWHAYLTWESADSRVTVTGFVKNIADEPVVLNVGGEPGSSIVYVSLGPPRTYGVTLSYRY